MLQIALEPNTPRLLHATIAVFYGAIHTVAKISNLPDRVADTQAFLDDLCRVCLSDNIGELRLGCCLGDGVLTCFRVFGQNRPSSSSSQTGTTKRCTISSTSWCVPAVAASNENKSSTDHTL